jgi:endoribonuclease Dicer
VYDPPPEEYTYPSPTLLDCLSVFDLWAHLDIPWSNIQFRYQATRAELGPYCAELFLYDDIKHRVRQALESNRCSPNTEDCDRDVEMQPPRNLDLVEDLLHIDSIMKDFDLLLQSASEPDLPPPLIPVDWCSPKVKALVDILAEHMSPNFQGIVFVEQRQVAACLARVLPCFRALTGLVRCAELVGQTATEHVKGMKIRQQTDIVRSFRDGAINLREYRALVTV